MNALTQKLLAPISEAQPCGPDFSNDPKFDELESILKGKPEVEMGSVHRPAEPPDWNELKEKSAKFLGESKHLRIAVILCCSLLKTDGLSGFRDGLQLIKEWLAQYWLALYPQLYPDDNNDPTHRLNILGTLTAPRASVTGWLTIVDYLYAVEICRPKGLPPITIDQIFLAKAQPVDAPETVKLYAAIRSADNNLIIGYKQTLQESLEAVRQIDQFLTTTLGTGNTINFEVLEKTLQKMISTLEPFPSEGVPDTDPATGSNAVGSVGKSATIAIRGSIRSREDVVRALDGICDYFEQVEPSSPVPYLLRRAQKLAKMDFVQAVQELNLATVDSLRPSMGSTVDAGKPPSA